MKVVTPATEASDMPVGHVSKMFDAGKNGQQLIDVSVTRLKNELAENDPSHFRMMTRRDLPTCVHLKRSYCKTWT